MKRYFLLSFVILSFVFTACSGDDSSSNEDSFDPDEIANVNNGEEVDFSQYENVWIPENGSDEGMSGIVNIAWTLYGENDICGELFITDSNFAGGRYKLNTPYYVYCVNGTEYYAGTFNLYKKTSNFYVKTIVDKKLNDNNEWVQIQVKEKTRNYIVKDGKLIFN